MAASDSLKSVINYFFSCTVQINTNFLCKALNIFLPIIFSICFGCSKEVVYVFMGRSRGGWGGGQGVLTPQPPPPPLKNHKNIEFLSNTVPDPLKNHKATKPAFNVGPSSASQQNTIKMVFRWWADDGPYIVTFGSSIPSSKKQQQKNIIKFGQPLTKNSGSVHVFWLRNMKFNFLSNTLNCRPVYTVNCFFLFFAVLSFIL